MQFYPFTEQDFNAYLDHKWQSNVFNRERLEVKQKLTALGRLLSPMMLASNGAPLECEVSSEHPALWNQHRVQNQYLFFSRNQASRPELDNIINKKRSIAALIEDPSPLRNHLFLSVMINKQQIELALKLHSDAVVDRDNLLRKCQEFFQREKLVNMIAGLPEEYFIGLAGIHEIPTSECTDPQLQQLLQEFSNSSGSMFEIHRSLPRDNPLVRENTFVDFSKEQFGYLLPILHYIAWTRDNDYVLMRDTLKKQEIKQKSRGLTKNDTIRVMRGMLSGKTGVIQEIDAKGNVKALVGNMLVKLNSSDVEKI